MTRAIVIIRSRTAAMLALIGVVGVVVAVGAFAAGSTAKAQDDSLTARVATWKSAGGVIELCVDLRDAADETRLCPEQRKLAFAKAPEGRWMRSRSVAIAPEVEIWVRARRVGDWLDLGLGVSIEGEARGWRSSSWSLQWTLTPNDQWRRTSAISLSLPVAPHPELHESGADSAADSAAGMAAGMAEGAPRLELGEPAPEFYLPQLGAEDEELISLSSARSGTEQVTLIVFWASWAPFVAETLAMLGDLARSDEGVQAVGVNAYEMAEGAGAAFIGDDGAETLHLVDADGTVAQHYRVDGLPEIFVLDEAGVYRAVIRGAAPLSEILAALEALE